MEIKVLGCYGGADKKNRLTSFLVNGHFVVDAGALSTGLTFDEQKEVTDIYISHMHLDHTVGLPFLLDNVFGLHDQPIRLYASASVVQHLRKHMFNDICWPDFSKLPSKSKPTLEYIEVEIEKEFTVADLRIVPVLVNHLVPTAGIIVTEENRSWIYPSDTNNTERIWSLVNELPDPRLLFLECSFPNRFKNLASESKHLTPMDVERQLGKINRKIPTRLYHFKPNAVEEIKAEIAKIDHPDIKFMEQDSVYKV